MGLIIIGVVTPQLTEAALTDRSRQDAIDAAETLLAASELGSIEPVKPLPAAGDGRLVQLRNADGEVVAATDAAVRVSGDGSDLELLSGRPDAVLDRDAGWVEGTFDPDTLGDPWQVTSRSTDGPGGEWTVHIATPGISDDTVQMVATVMAVLGPLLWVAVVAMTWCAMGRALRPVDRVRAQAGAAAAAGVPVPLDVPSTSSELSALVDTFNDLLVRVADSVARQRRFVTDASHELLTPLSSLRTQLEVAQRYEDTDWPGVADQCLALEARLSETADSLLALARLDAAPEPAPGHELDLVGVIEEQLTVSCASADTRLPNQLFVLGDRVALGRLVRNLLDNAAHHAADLIEVTLQQEEGNAVLRIDDDGPGVPVAQRERVFEPFVRLDESRSRESGGAGLGLAIASAVAHAHRGTIVCVESPFGGARFQVELPTADTAPPEEGDARDRYTTPPHQREAPPALTRSEQHEQRPSPPVSEERNAPRD